ncbi:tryptophan synthase subunit alpha, partial [Spirochaetota bacterium]
YNILFNFGVEDFVVRSKKIGLFGLIVPDIPPEEDDGIYFSACINKGINPIVLVSPTTSRLRLKEYINLANGFVYSTSRIGITGAGKNPHKKLESFIGRLKKIINLPVAIGFGIDSPESAKSISKHADIIVIGSIILKIVNENPEKYPDMLYYFLSNVKKSINAD